MQIHNQTHTTDLVDLILLDNSIRLDIVYATPDNFTGVQIYPQARAFLQRPVAEALLRVQHALAQRGYGLLIFDAYRPWHVTQQFWQDYPQYRNYLADPIEGSRHNRGCAVDLALCDIHTGTPLTMPCAYDDFSERAHPTYTGGTAEQLTNRDDLRQAMELENFTVHTYEWWHFDFSGWETYPILDLEFSQIA